MTKIDWSPIIFPTKEEIDIAIWYSAWTDKISREAGVVSKKVSKLSDLEIGYRGKLAELMYGRVSGAAVDITIRTTGDGHRGDLMFPWTTASFKMRGGTPLGYILTPKQGTRLLDPIGVVGYCFDKTPEKGMYIVGYVLEEDWDRLVQDDFKIPVGRNTWQDRIAVPFKDLTGWSSLRETIQTLEDRGRERGERQRLRSGRVYVHHGKVRIGMDDEV